MSLSENRKATFPGHALVSGARLRSVRTRRAAAFIQELIQFGTVLRGAEPFTNPVGKFLYIQDPIAANYDQIKVNLAAITDLEVNYEVIHGVKVSLGANNLLNVYPTKQPAVYRNALYNTNNQGYASSVYPGNSPFGYNGGFYYGRVTWSF